MEAIILSSDSLRAAYIDDWGKPLSIKDVPKPQPGPGEVLVRLRVTGVCHTDLHQWKGDWPLVKIAMEAFNVRILGHEGVGVVEEVGPGVTRLQRGDRVGVPWMNDWDGTCEICLSGYPHWCVNAKITSVHVNGTYAEYALISEKAAPKIPKELSDVDVAGMLCGGVTAYGAVRKLVTEARIPPGKPIAIVGAAGGLGHYAVQIAKAFGYTVVGIDVGVERIEFVKKLGADYAVEASEAEAFVKEKLGGVYASLVFAPRISGYNLGIRILRTMGTLVVIGAPSHTEGSFNAVPIDILASGMRILPSVVGVTHEFEELFNLALQGKVRSHVALVKPLSEVNDVFERLEKTRYVGRAVLQIQ